MKTRFDLGLLITLFVCSFALLPLARQSGLPQGYDVLYHTYRVAEMQRSWEAGVYLPQWADSFYFGYGYPVFHYYASSTYYLTSLLITLTGMSAIQALRGIIMASLLGGGAGMYLFTKRQNGQLGGLIAAVVYVYSPYLLYTEPYTRGDYPELFAFGLFPWLLWRFDRLRLPAPTPKRATLRVILAAGSVGLLIITHNLMALVFFGLLVGWLAWLTGWGELTRKQSLQLWLAAGLGVGLATYFWLPVFAERDAVQLDNLIEVAELDYRNFFMPLSTLLSPPIRGDGGAINGLIPRYQIGLGGAILGLAGLLTVLYFGRDRKQFSSFYFALLAGVMIFLMTPQAARIWETVTPLAYLQFPWRFLGPLAACLAILSSANGVWLERLSLRWQILGGMIICLFPMLLAIPYFYVPQWDLKTVDTSVEAYQAAEVAGLQRGTTFSGEFLPKDVFVVPDANARLLADFADGRPIDKLHYEVLPAEVAVQWEAQNPHYNRWQMTAKQPFSVEVLTFYFSGWEARVNGEKVPITPSVPHGLITFAVPAGDSVVEVALVNTPLRKAANALSFTAFLGVLGLAYWSQRQHDTSPPADEKSTSPLLVIGGGILSLFAIILLIGFRSGTAWLESPQGQALAADHPITYHLGETFQLIGYDLTHAGNRLEVNLYWYAHEIPQDGYASFVHISTGGPPVAQSDRQNPGGIPTVKWTPEGYIFDPHVIYLPDGLPAGEYQVLVGLWTCAGIPADQPCGNGLRPVVTDAAGLEIGDSIPLTTLQIR